jgi:outer membrane lipoprotein-sorting protein
MSVNSLRRLPTLRLFLFLGTLLAAGAAAAVIVVTATSGTSTAPPAEPLAQAVHDSLGADAPQGVTARVVFTNKLLPSSDLFGNFGSALLSGASGRLWLTNDGQGRIELQSDAGDTQIVWDSSTLSVYDASSNTAYKVALPQSSTPDTTTTSPAPTLAEISSALAKLAEHANVSEASPEVAAGQPAYTVSVSPKANGGLFGDAQLTWAAANGVPLRLAITAKGDSSPVLELKVTDISFGSVASSDVAIPPPAGAKVVDLGAPASGSGSDPKEPAVTGIDAVRAAVAFPLTAPASVGDLSLSSARLVGKGALLTYGDGLGALVVHENAAGAGGVPSALGALPKVSLGSISARELQTPLGTVLSFDSGGVSFLVGGSMTNTDAEAAAKAFA